MQLPYPSCIFGEKEGANLATLTRMYGFFDFLVDTG
jgi:hypothetical protein